MKLTFALGAALCGLLLIETSTAHAQGWDGYEGGAKLEFGTEKDKWVRMITWAQIWGRIQQQNPGTTVAGSDSEWQSDIALRRARFLVFGKPRKDLLFLLHLGINNQTFRSRENLDAGIRTVNPFAFVHGAWVEQSIIDKHLYIGGGLHYWWGISRMTNASTLNFMTIDSPIFTWPFIQLSDQFARQLGIYAKGKLGRLDYRVALNRPFTVPTDPTTVSEESGALYNPEANTYSFGGYFNYQFWDQESNTLPYTVGTYIGKKSVFNVGAGFYHQPDAMISRNATDELVEEDQTLFALDLFLDTPLGADSGAISLYAGYFDFDFGENHLRNIGIMNIGTGGSTLNGRGNAYPMIGSGSHYYAQAGYVLPFTLTEDEHQVMPFVATQVSDFDALDDVMGLYEAGFNYFVAGHHAKYTLQYRNRPVYTTTSRGFTRSADRAGELLLQAHFWF